MTVPSEITEGLGDAPKSEWPRITSVDKPAIERLVPGSSDHQRVLDYLLARLNTSEKAMEEFYPRWSVSEMKIQAYIDLPEWEKVLKNLTDEGKPPKLTRIVVPYSFATISTITTFLLHAFTGRRPLFQVSAWKGEHFEAAQNMEHKLQYDSDHTRLIKHLWGFLQDTQTYGLGAMLCLWRVQQAMRSRRKDMIVFTDGGVQQIKVPAREMTTIYEGNEVSSLDVYKFFPDPRVPMAEVNRRGEYVFWRVDEGVHTLKDLESAGLIKWVRNIPSGRPSSWTEDRSNRTLLSGGSSRPGAEDWYRGSPTRFIQIDQGTVDIIPRELGLSESEKVEKWLFAIGNKGQIIQAELFDCDHGLHPVAVTEPYSLGHSFGAPGMADYLMPIQDTVSWFFNSHFDNVRKVLNDMLIVDPSMVEMQDLKDPEPGKLIRLKRAAFGQDVRAALQQLQLVDVTKEHVKDATEIIRLGQLLSAVNDNILGMQSEGGRKTAAEVRISGQSAASRLAAQTRIISAQAITDLTEMMSLNNQQHLTDEFFLMVLGADGQKSPLRVTPDQITGDFHYPVHDGTLPIDKVAMLDVWKELFLGMLSDQELRRSYSIPKIFEYIAELGGARNIESFRLAVMPDKQFDQALQSGNIVSPQAAAGSLNGNSGGAQAITERLGGF